MEVAFQQARNSSSVYVHIQKEEINTEQSLINKEIHSLKYVSEEMHQLKPSKACSSSHYTYQLAGTG